MNEVQHATTSSFFKGVVQEVMHKAGSMMAPTKLSLLQKTWEKHMQILWNQPSVIGSVHVAPSLEDEVSAVLIEENLFEDKLEGPLTEKDTMPRPQWPQDDMVIYCEYESVQHKKSSTKWIVKLENGYMPICIGKRFIEVFRRAHCEFDSALPMS